MITLKHEVRTLQVSVEFVHSPDDGQCFLLSHRVILLPRKQFVASIHDRMFDPIVLLD